MKILQYTVDLSLSNTPSVRARVLVVDPISGAEAPVDLHAVDDDARAICEMVDGKPDDSGHVGTVASGRVNHDALEAFVAARVTQAAAAPLTLAESVKAREEHAQTLAATRDASAKLAALNAQIEGLQRA